MIRSGWFAALVVVLASLPCLAEGGPQGNISEELTLQVEMADGQVVCGKLILASVIIDSDVGEYEIKPRKIKKIRFTNPGDEPRGGMDGPHVRGIVVTTGDKEISGYVHVPNWKLETDLGTLTLSPRNLKLITFVTDQDRPNGGDKTK